MRFKYICSILTCIFLFASHWTIAQQIESKKIKLMGKVVDQKNKGIEAASVQFFIKSADGIKDSLLGGMLTRANGDFNIESFPYSDSLKIAITAIGYSDFIVMSYMESSMNEKDLGNIRLAQDSKFLNTVTVVGQKPAMEMAIDRKVFNVEKNITSAGGTAIDVMKNIPSVSVDVDGNVLLRNNAPQIFVDGLPTILTLEQIPADNIDRVELFTNPSAKFDASSRGGIINVILKKNRKNGLNGIVAAGLGSPKIATSNITLNLRQGKFNFFVNGNYNQSGGRAKGETKRQNKSADTIQNYFDQQSLTERIRKFSSIRFGLDLFATNRTTITLSQNFVWGKSTSDEEQSQIFSNYIKVPERNGSRVAVGAYKNTRSNTQVSYKYRFPKQGKELSADINYNRGKSTDATNILNSYFNLDGTQYAEPIRVRNAGDNNNKQFTFQSDFINPITENQKLEMGVRAYSNQYTSIFNSFAVQPTGEIKLPLSNHYKYLEQVNAAYITYSNKLKPFSYQAGIRFEHSEFKGELVDSALKFGYSYPKDLGGIFDALFPSLFLTRELSEGEEIQLNYTRRVRRPNFWQLNPFVDISDPYNLQQGNPALQPEFTNSYEFNYNKQYGNRNNLLAVLYHQRSAGEMTRFGDTITTEQYTQLNNAAVDQNAILNTFINAASETVWGLELTLQQNLGKSFDFSPNINFQYQKIIVDNPGLNISNQGFNWEAQMTINYRISTSKPSILNKTSIQWIGEYESSEITPQGKNKPQYYMDLAVRRDLFKGNKGSLVLGINDVFNSRRFAGIYDTDNFYQEFFRRRNVRNFRITFTYRFGDSDLNLFRKSRERESGGSDEGPDN